MDGGRRRRHMTAGGRQATWLSEGDDAGVSKLAAKAQYGKPAEGSASFRRTLVGDNLHIGHGLLSASQRRRPEV